MYGIISLLGLFIRQFCLPNPFATYGENAELYNWACSALLPFLTYGIVGVFYESGHDDPVNGSILYSVVYIILTLIIAFANAIVSYIILYPVVSGVVLVVCVVGWGYLWWRKEDI